MYPVSFQRLFVVTLALALVCRVAQAQGQVPAVMNFKTEAFLLKNKIVARHYNPPAIDDAFSAAALDLFLDDLDPDHLIFTAGEVQTLKTYGDKLDDEINGKSWNFLPAATRSYQKGARSCRTGNKPGNTTRVRFQHKGNLYRRYALDERRSLHFRTLAPVTQIRNACPANEYKEQECC